MPFSQFLGNQRIVDSLRGFLRSRRVPHALLFAGPRGMGKYTLACLFAQAANCERHEDDACGQCDSCRRIGGLLDPAPLIEQGLSERGENSDAATVERVPLILQTHPDVWALVPDPVRLRNPVFRPVLRIGQLRAVQRAAYFKPLRRRRVFLLEGADTMQWNVAGVFLKILEEPPESATLILLASNPFGLLPTILSRCLQLHFTPLDAVSIDTILKERTEWKPAQRKVAVSLAEGSPGAALTLDLDATIELRREALAILERAARAQGYAQLFAQTAALAKGREHSLDAQLEAFYSLLGDLLELSCQPKQVALRNPQLQRELESLSRAVTPEWIMRAVEGLDELHGRARRNINRQLGLDAVATGLGLVSRPGGSAEAPRGTLRDPAAVHKAPFT
jgi:DNA polymerase-3 subunit delta'